MTFEVCFCYILQVQAENKEEALTKATADFDRNFDEIGSFDFNVIVGRPLIDFSDME